MFAVATADPFDLLKRQYDRVMNVPIQLNEEPASESYTRFGYRYIDPGSPEPRRGRG